jgi:hypothetical protein
MFRKVGLHFVSTMNDFVQAIRGLLFGFRRGDSVISKIQTAGKNKCVVFLSEILMKSACERKVEIVLICFA